MVVSIYPGFTADEPTTAGRALVTAANAPAQRSLLGLGYEVADDSAVVHLAGEETISGAKTFSGGATINQLNMGSYGQLVGVGGMAVLSDGNARIGLDYSGKGLQVSSGKAIGFTPNSLIDGADSDVQFKRESAGVVGVYQQDGQTHGSLNASTIANSSGPLLLTGGGRTLRIDEVNNRMRLMNNSAAGIDIQANEATGALLRVTYASADYPLSVYKTISGDPGGLVNIDRTRLFVGSAIVMGAAAVKPGVYLGRDQTVTWSSNPGTYQGGWQAGLRSPSTGVIELNDGNPGLLGTLQVSAVEDPSAAIRLGESTYGVSLGGNLAAGSATFSGSIHSSVATSSIQAAIFQTTDDIATRNLTEWRSSNGSTVASVSAFGGAAFNGVSRIGESPQQGVYFQPNNAGHSTMQIGSNTAYRTAGIGFWDAINSHSWRMGRNTYNNNFYIQPGYIGSGIIDGINGLTISPTGDLTASGVSIVGGVASVAGTYTGSKAYFQASHGGGIFQVREKTGAKWDLYASSVYGLSFSTNAGVEALHLDASQNANFSGNLTVGSGNVLLGTQSDDGLNRLQVVGDATFSDTITLTDPVYTGTLELNANAYSGVGGRVNLKMVGSGIQEIQLISGGVTSWLQANAGSIQLSGTAGQASLTEAGWNNDFIGKVSINTTASAGFVPLTLTGNSTIAVPLFVAGTSVNPELFTVSANGNVAAGKPSSIANQQLFTAKVAGNAIAAIQEGIIANYGGSLVLYDGSGGTSNYLRLEYSAGYPKLSTSRTNLSLQASGALLRLTGTYADLYVGVTQTAYWQNVGSAPVYQTRATAGQTGPHYNAINSSGVSEFSITQGGNVNTIGSLNIGPSGSELAQISSAGVGTFGGNIQQGFNSTTPSHRGRMLGVGQHASEVGDGAGTWQTGYREEYNASGMGCGFYGATPIARQQIDSASAALAADLLAALNSLGLVEAI